MASCRSRKTGNCSDYSENKFLQEKSSGTFSQSSPIPGSLGGGHPVPMAPTWHWSGKPFLLDLCIRLPGLDGAKDSKALSGIACAWEIEQKRVCHRRVFAEMSRAACL